MASAWGSEKSIKGPSSHGEEFADEFSTNTRRRNFLHRQKKFYFNVINLIFFSRKQVNKPPKITEKMRFTEKNLI